MRRTLLLSTASTALLLAPGCGGGSAPTKPALRAQETVTIAPPPATTAPRPPRPPASPFHVAVEGDRELVVSNVTGRSFVHDRGMMSVGTFIAEIVDGKVVLDPAHSIVAGMRDFILGAHMAGSFPDNAYLAGMGMHSRTGQIGFLYKWDKGEWKTVGNYDGIGLALSGWSQGRVLAMETGAGMPFSYHLGFSVFGGEAGAITPVARVSKKPPTECASEIHAHAFTALPTGHVYVVGDLCGADEGKDPDWSARVEWWAPNEKQSNVDALPRPSAGAKELSAKGIWASSPASVVVAGDVKEGKPYLARLGATKWELIETPPSDLTNVVSMTGGDDGTLLLVLSSTDDGRNSERGELWQRGAGGAWTKLLMPSPEIVPGSVWMLGKDDLWVAATTGAGDHSKNLILHNGTPSPALKAPDMEEMQRVTRKYRMARPYEPSCETPFALLLTLSQATPSDFDFPAVRAALKGHTELERATFIDFEQAKKRYFGAKVEDEAMGRKLVALVKSKIRDATAQLVCHDPEPTRTLRIDLRTGEMK